MLLILIPNGQINNIVALIQILTWRRPDFEMQITE